MAPLGCGCTHILLPSAASNHAWFMDPPGEETPRSLSCFKLQHGQGKARQGKAMSTACTGGKCRAAWGKGGLG